MVSASCNAAVNLDSRDSALALHLKFPACASSESQEQWHDARVRHLEELLNTARRERDEFRDRCIQLKGRLLSMGLRLPQEGLGLTMEPQSRAHSGLQLLDSVASTSEPSTILQLDYVSPMSELTGGTLTEVHRRMQEQQQQQLELQQLDMQQLQHHHMDLPRQHSSHTQLDLRPIQSEQQHQWEELHEHFEIQQQDHSPGQPLFMDMGMNEGQSDVLHSGDSTNGRYPKSSTWNGFPSSASDIHSSNEQCSVLFDPLERFWDPTFTSMHIHRPLHLPAPPEADLQVMLSTLPEKGKLVEAMASAEPLLQTILL